MDDPVETIKALELARYLPLQPTAKALERLSLSWEDYSRSMQGAATEREQSYFAAYRRLSPEQGREVVLYALKLFDATIYKDQYLPHELLAQVANVVPDALQGLYSELLTREIFWKSVYREADPATRDHLFRLVDEKAQESVTLNHLLEALAWIGDEAVQAQFHQWRQHPPAWRSSLYISPHEYASVAGWKLTEEGRRDLFYPTCYELMPVRQAAPGGIPGPVDVIAPHEEHCHWCGLQLTALFDLDLRDPRLAFLGLEGERLRIAMCERCMEPILTDVDWQGGSRWSLSNPAQSTADWSDLEIERLPQHQLVLGPLRRTPYETVGTYQCAGISQIGGHPEWVQDADYPPCPTCQRAMMFLGQVEALDIVEHAEGIYYAFLCAQCGKATTGYQQT